MLKCPECDSPNDINVVARVTVRLKQIAGEVTGSDPVDGNHEWHDDSPASCGQCGFRGTVLNFDPETPTESLTDLRRAAADAAFANYDMRDAEVKDSCGWDSTDPGDEWSRVFFVEADGGPSSRELFVVRFKPGTAEVKEAYWCC